MNHSKPPSRLIFLGLTLIYFQAWAATAPAEVRAKLVAGEPVDLIVEYEDREISREATTLRQKNRAAFDDLEVLTLKARRYRELKGQIDAATRHKDVRHLSTYSHLPMALKRFSSEAGLSTLLRHQAVKAVYSNLSFQAVLPQSLPLISQPSVSSAGQLGTGTTVAVLDGGLDLTNSAFGTCTAPGVPASCRVAAKVTFGTGSSDVTHGTNVSAIVLGVAPASKIAMVDVFSGTSASTSDVLSGINWSIANRLLYNIVAVNMSLGGSTKFSAPCSSANPFLTALTNAANAGIHVVAASGNAGYSDGIASPACTPGAISVGAVYDTNVGGLNFGNICADATTRADQVACFSNSASFLTMLAPGSTISAGGITQSGTSQAAPHVAGALAILRSTYPGETLAQVQGRLTANGVGVLDSRNGLTKPRLNLLAAARPANDAFANRAVLGGSSGTYLGSSILASREAGEPTHAGVNGNASVWWKWIAPSSGQLSLDTHGSGFDTLLASYQGSALGTLNVASSNDNDGSVGFASAVLFQVQGGTEYAIAVDGVAGTSGSIALHWSLNTNAQANLAASISGPNNVSVGATTRYNVIISNAGPQTATMLRISVTLPATATIVSNPQNCTAGAAVLTCLVSSLGNGAGLTLPIDIVWSNLDTPTSIMVNVASDLPDTVTSNNSGTLQVSTAISDGDVPTLPEWGLLLLGGLLLGAMQRYRS